MSSIFRASDHSSCHVSILRAKARSSKAYPSKMALLFNDTDPNEWFCGTWMGKNTEIVYSRGATNAKLYSYFVAKTL